jgi:hypothetical protein
MRLTRGFGLDALDASRAGVESAEIDAGETDYQHEEGDQVLSDHLALHGRIMLVDPDGRQAPYRELE